MMKWAKKADKILTKGMTSLADRLGRPSTLLMIILLIAGWFAARFFLDYDTWFDIMDISIFLTTFVFLFIIQSSQNADTKAIQDKLDDIIHALPKAHNSKEGEEKRIKHGSKSSR